MPDKPPAWHAGATKTRLGSAYWPPQAPFEGITHVRVDNHADTAANALALQVTNHIFVQVNQVQAGGKNDEHYELWHR